MEAGEQERWCLSANFPEFYDSELVYSGAFIIFHVKVGGSESEESSSEEVRWFLCGGTVLSLLRCLAAVGAARFLRVRLSVGVTLS